MRSARVIIHESQFPESVRRALIASLRNREINHKFHYDSVKQATQWLRLHEAYSPARRDADCLATYQRAFAEAAGIVGGTTADLDLISLGCGGGQKDLVLKRALNVGRCRYFPIDVSVAMTLVARSAALTEDATAFVQPAVCDLQGMDDLPAFLSELSGQQPRRLLAFFGMIPNFEPEMVLRQITGALRPGEYLLLSANLAPGRDYRAGVEQVLPLYANDLTRDWLMLFLEDVGIRRDSGDIQFTIQSREQLLRIEAAFIFKRSSEVTAYDQSFSFAPGDHLRLFFSYRYTPENLDATLRTAGLCVQKTWITRSEEEGIFLCQRAS